MTRMTPAIGFPRCRFVPSSGTSELETLADSFAFGLQPPFTDLVVTKILNYDSAGIVTTCEANWDTTLVVVANPEVVLDAAAGICQEDSTSVVAPFPTLFSMRCTRTRGTSMMPVCSQVSFLVKKAW